jgi:hypothetical protein
LEAIDPLPVEISTPSDIEGELQAWLAKPR